MISRLPHYCAFGLALLLAGCANASDAREWQTSSVGVEASGCGLIPAVGSGAVVVEAGLVVTTAHIVAGSRQIEVIDHEGVAYEAVLWWLDPDSDVALLSVPGLTAAPLELGSVGEGDEGSFVAWDRRSGFRTSSATVIRELSVTIEDIYIDRQVSRRAIEFRGEVEPGDSGAAVVHDGNVVGMIYAKARDVDNLGYALAHQELADALTGLGSENRSPIESGRCTP